MEINGTNINVKYDRFLCKYPAKEILGTNRCASDNIKLASYSDNLLKVIGKSILSCKKNRKERS